MICQLLNAQRNSGISTTTGMFNFHFSRSCLMYRYSMCHGGYSDYWHGESKISEKRILLTVEIESSQLQLKHSMSRVVMTGHCTKYLWPIWLETVQLVRSWELQAITRLFRRVSNELFWVNAKYHNLMICPRLLDHFPFYHSYLMRPSTSF